ncbi:aldose 1-epimerase [Dyella acidiphila]|uniref:Aldose 1-epimerase n=1 Tax=Dyella acidiphila TaxID=2775866 RepID=A0ABR9GD96_9GAMM|nr:aldose 1-epimerase [Dyella acidiphila]MBE1162016.1 aldose 1-epimerase [Dyella acidiphila]
MQGPRIEEQACWLENKHLRVQVLPAQGGGLGSFEWLARDAAFSLLRPYRAAPANDGAAFDPNRLACYPLVPWSNRISGGGFDFAGTSVALSPNCPGEPYPIHGSGWRRSWAVQSHGGEQIQLRLDERAPDGYSYRAMLTYALRGNALEIGLSISNTGDAALPFGLGLHPFIALHDGVSLHAPAARVWQNDGRSPLPSANVPVPADWDFRQPQVLPREVLNHCFLPWSGEASVNWPRQGMRMQILANVDAFLLYTPDDADFFCFEPVDHPIDAVHLPGGPLAHGMTALAPGEHLCRHFSFRVEDAGAAAAPPSPGTAFGDPHESTP